MYWAFDLKTQLDETFPKAERQFEIRNFKSQKWVSIFLSYIVEHFFSGHFKTLTNFEHNDHPVNHNDRSKIKANL